MANVRMDYKDFPLKQCGFSLKLRADSAPVIGPVSALGPDSEVELADVDFRFTPSKQTSSGRAGMSVQCQSRHAP